jgi:hypothetical protein
MSDRIALGVRAPNWNPRDRERALSRTRKSCILAFAG